MRNIYQPIALLVAFTYVSLTSLAQSQTGPGGVGTSTNLHVWLDASQLTLSNGDPVANWTDISGNGNNFTQFDVSRQPSFSQTGLINDRPAVSFTSDVISSTAISALNTDVLSYFIVYRNQSSLPSGNNFGMILSTRSSLNNIEWAYQLKRENNSLVRVERYARQSTSAFSIAKSDLNNTENLSSAIGNGIWRGSNDIYGQWNGAETSSTAGAVSSGFSHVFTNLGAALDAGNNPIRFFTGDVSEIIIYNSEINSAQEKIIFNNLSAKYNITLGGSVIYAHNATHPNEVAGIGRDNVSNQHLSAKGSSIMEVTAGSLDDGDYLLWGHDEAGLVPQTADAPDDYIQFLGERFSQVWRVTEVNEVGDLTIVFDMTGIHFGFPDDYELLIDADGVFATGATRISGVLVGDELTFNVLAGQLSNGNFMTIGNSKESYIFSIADDQDWNDPTTWNCTCIPNSSNDFVAIISGHTVNISGNESVGNLEITLGTTLLIGSGASLDVVNGLDVDGTLISNTNGTVSFDQGGVCLLSGAGTFNLGNMLVDNSTQLTLESGPTYIISGILTPTSGTIDFNNQPFLFASSASGTSSIGVVGGAAIINNADNLSVQRNVNAGIAGYRNLGTPLNLMALRQWDDELFISGPGFPDGCASSSSGCYLSARFWKASTQAYEGISDINELISNGSGIEIWLGDNLTSFSATTLTSTGTPNFNVSSNISILSGWNLIANPFMSSINFHNVIRNSGNIGNYFYVFNPNTNAFEWYDAASSTFSSNWTNAGILSSSQGFWVFNNGAPSSITFNQGSKSFGVDGFFKNEHSNQLVVKLIENGKEEGAACVIELNNDASYGFDENLDMPAFPYQIRLSNQIYSKSVDDQSLVFNSRPEESNCIKIPLFLDVADDNSFKIQFDKLPQGYTCYMIDERTKTVSKINDNSIFYFDAQSGSEQNRYSVLLTKNTQECNLMEDDYATRFKVHTYQNTVFVALEGEITDFTVEIKNLLGQTVYHSKLYSETSNEQFVLDVNDGVYLVEIKSHSGNIISTSKVFINK